MLLFALGLSMVTGVVFGIARAWVTSDADPIEDLRRHWPQKTLVIAQLAAEAG